MAITGHPSLAARVWIAWPTETEYTMREFRYTAAIVMIPLLLSMLACGDEDSAATSACGSCPEGYYCASGDDGYFCQASDDQGQTSNVTEDRPSQDRDRPIYKYMNL